MSIRVINVNASIYSANDDIAFSIRNQMTDKGILFINLMASPGAGKTTLISKLIDMLRDEYEIGIMEADIDGIVDAETLYYKGIRTIQVHTGGECAMNAGMVKDGLDNFDLEGMDILIMENVGNLVCPAEVDTGAHCNMVILSVPEGDDKPLKYPLMFEKADLLLVNKIDAIDYFDFDESRLIDNVRLRNKNTEIMFVSGYRGDNMESVAQWIKNKLNELRSK